MYDYIVFTDGSSIKNDKEIWIGGTGTIILDLNRGKKYDKRESLYNSTNNYAELHSVKTALDMIEKLTKKKDCIRILIISDSEYCCNGLSTDVYKWSDGKTRNDTWRNSSGVLMNQELIKYIYYNYLQDSKYDIDFLHLNSHLSERNEDAVKRVIEKTKNQGFIIDRNTAKTMIRLNSKADKMSYDAAKEGSKSEVI